MTYKFFKAKGVEGTSLFCICPQLQHGYRYACTHTCILPTKPQHSLQALHLAYFPLKIVLYMCMKNSLALL